MRASSDLHQRVLSQPTFFSDSQMQSDALFAAFSEQACNGHLIASTTLAAGAFSIGSTLAKALLSTVLKGASLSSAAFTLGILGEAAALRGANQALCPGAEDWLEGRSFQSTLIDLLCLKGTGAFLGASSFSLKQVGQTSAMVLGGYAAETLKLRENSSQNFSSRCVHALSSNFAMETGAFLASGVSSGRFNLIQRTLSFKSRVLSFNGREKFTSVAQSVSSMSRNGSFPQFDSPAINMGLGMIIGDAFGMGHEFRGTREEIAATLRARPGYISHILTESPDRAALARKVNFIFHYPHEAGTLSDDAQSTMGVMEALLAPPKLDELLLVAKMHRAYHRDPIPGYSSRVEEVFRQFPQPDAVENVLRVLLERNKSIGNGAGIRSIPFGFLPRVKDVVDASVLSAQITHDTSIGRDSAVLISLMAHAIYYGKVKGPLAEGLYQYLRHFNPLISAESAALLREVHRAGPEYPRFFGRDFFEIGGVKIDGIPCHGMETVGGVLYLLEQFSGRPQDLLRQAVLLGGDADSVAALAMGLEGMRNGLASLNPYFFHNLNDGTPRSVHRKIAMINLGSRISQRYPSPVHR